MYMINLMNYIIKIFESIKSIFELTVADSLKYITLNQISE